MTLKIHAFPPSPRGFKVLAVAEHLGVPYQFAFVDLTSGTQKSPEFTALNPNQRMPVLEEGDFTLWESDAISQYLATKKPESGMLPKDEQARANVSRWMFWCGAHWDPACANLIFERVVKAMFGGGAADPKEVEKGLASFNRLAGILNAHLRGRKFVTGDQITVADFSLGAPLIMAEPAGLPVAEYPEIARWYAQLAALPAWQKALAMGKMPQAA
jgi:glutathione S-transferase